jgi:hexosaminidase
MELFPSQIVHIGGDEVRYDQWKSSAAVSEYMRSNDINSYPELQISFTNGVSKFLQQNGHRMMGWNDILGGLHDDEPYSESEAKQKLSPGVIIHFWSGDPKIVNQAVEKGFDVVNSYWEYTYIDYDYKTTSLNKAYGFDPVPETLPDSLHHKILGLGCQMWGEWIPTVEKMNYRIYPRIAAFAETGWSDKNDKKYEKFLTALKEGYLMKHWEKEGIAIKPGQFE